MVLLLAMNVLTVLATRAEVKVVRIAECAMAQQSAMCVKVILLQDIREDAVFAEQAENVNIAIMAGRNVVFATDLEFVRNVTDNIQDNVHGV